MHYRSIIAGAAVASALWAAPASAEDLVFMLDNKASISIREFYASAVNVDNWEEDILGQDILEPENFARITISNSETCEYDLKIVFEGDKEMEERNIDLCETGSYTVTDP
jgi:bifunctional N-acetylglucosamine-1-phosphate-uridyltransferase/glucosamine-1-phosphate-acetyltransferase GlmU-like protein